METMDRTVITVEATVNAPTEKVWDIWTSPEHITKWNNASADWHTPTATNDLKTGGKFVYRMEAKDGSMGFDFNGIYDEIRPFEYIEYTMSDDRKVKVKFESQGNQTHIIESFEAESQHPLEMQRDGWQAILNNFKTYTEQLS